MRVSKALMPAALSAIGVLSAFAPGAQADTAGTFQARPRGVVVPPQPSATIRFSGTNIGGKTAASDSFTPEADLTYFVTNSVAGRVSDVWLLPPTVAAQCHFDWEGAVRPSVGAGVGMRV